MHVGQLESSPPVLRITFVAAHAISFKAVDTRSGPGPTRGAPAGIAKRKPVMRMTHDRTVVPLAPAIYRGDAWHRPYTNLPIRSRRARGSDPDVVHGSTPDIARGSDPTGLRRGDAMHRPAAETADRAILRGPIVIESTSDARYIRLPDKVASGSLGAPAASRHRSAAESRQDGGAPRETPTAKLTAVAAHPTVSSAISPVAPNIRLPIGFARTANTLPPLACPTVSPG